MKIEVYPLQTISTKGAQCILLIVHLKGNSLQIMLDCGLNQQLETNTLRHYNNKILKSKLILMSQGSIEYAGGIPLLSEHSITTLATSPVADYGFRNFVEQLTLIQQAFIKKEQDDEEFKGEWKRILETAEEAYGTIRKLNLGQAQHFNYENGTFNVTVVPIRAGKTIGSCVWKIQINTVNIIYASDFGMAKELHIDSLNVEKLTFRNQPTNLALQKEQLDLLIVDNYPVHNKQEETTSCYVKQMMDEALRTFTNSKSKGQALFAFYPNERLLEGIMALDHLFNENPKYQGLRCEFATIYQDLVDKARGQTDFLGSQLVNWKHQELTIQSPFDPEYLKQRFGANSNSKSRAHVVLTTFNNLFTGPLHQESYLSDPNNIVVLFGQPPQFLNQSMGKVRTGFKGELNFKLNDQSSITLNYIRKCLLKNKESKLNNNAPSTTYLPGSTVDQTDSQSIDLPKSMDKLTDDQSSLEFQQEDPINYQSEPLFGKSNYKQHPQLFAVESYVENLIFPTQFTNPIRQMPQLFNYDDYGHEMPDYVNREASSLSKLISAAEEQQNQQECEQQQIEKDKLLEQNFAIPKLITQGSKQQNINAKITIRLQGQSTSNSEILLSTLNPGNIFILNPLSKPKHSPYSVQTATQSQSFQLINQQMGLQLPFVEANEFKGNVMSVQGQLSLSFKHNNHSMTQLLQLKCSKLQCQVGQNLQLIALYEQLAIRKDMNCQLGFSQILINNGQLIVSRSSTGFSLEGHYCPLYVQIRNIIQNQNT